MENSLRTPYNVDLVFCIDATGSMTPLIDMVKQNAINFEKDIAIAMQAKNKAINQLRIRIIVFRDFLADGNDAILATDFFTLPRDNDLFVKSVKAISAFGGGDIPEDGLEALAYAMRSKWMPADGNSKNRQIIVIWTDTGAHNLGHGAAAPRYPSAMPKTFGELSQWWPNRPGQPGALMDYSSARLVIFAPEDENWDKVFNNWANVVHFPSTAGNGLDDVQYEQIKDVVVNSIVVQRSGVGQQ